MADSDRNTLPIEPITPAELSNSAGDAAGQVTFVAGALQVLADHLFEYGSEDAERVAGSIVLLREELERVSKSLESMSGQADLAHRAKLF
ncbi:MAG: hypothetical protein U5S82_00345 [Gammaproteobacteria bacterium]|nr:hypothetical protein [Gammaproteobacteria bacterium]